MVAEYSKKRSSKKRKPDSDSSKDTKFKEMEPCAIQQELPRKALTQKKLLCR
jgi:hypothetical protein